MLTPIIQPSPQLTLSFVELYNGRLFDLFGPDPRAEIKLREDANGNVQVTPPMTAHIVSTVNEVEQRLNAGAKIRATTAMQQNDHSSRSHAVITLQIREKGGSSSSRDAREAASSSRDAREGKGGSSTTGEQEDAWAGGGTNAAAGAPCGRVTLVDLAGNERGQDTGYHASRRAKEEARNINSSLLALKECLRALSRDEDFFWVVKHYRDYDYNHVVTV